VSIRPYTLHKGECTSYTILNSKITSHLLAWKPSTYVYFLLQQESKKKARDNILAIITPNISLEESNLGKGEQKESEQTTCYR